MLRTHNPDPMRRRRIGIAVLALAFIAAAVGTWLAVASPRTNSPASPQAAPRLAVGNPATTEPEVTEPLSQLSATSGPESFAEAVAHALFDWDTTQPTPLSDYTGQLLAVADPTGQESPGLVADLASYLPTTEVWALLKPYYTRQWIEISSVTVPELWARALAEAGTTGLAPGTAAYTIRGTRHRAGVWEDEPVASAHGVAFTVFIVCEPSYPTCHLLRLSRLDEPLE
jgi:hypothetical protein